MVQTGAATNLGRESDLIFVASRGSDSRPRLVGGYAPSEPRTSVRGHSSSSRPPDPAFSSGNIDVPRTMMNHAEIVAPRPGSLSDNSIHTRRAKRTQRGRPGGKTNPTACRENEPNRAAPSRKTNPNSRRRKRTRTRRKSSPRNTERPPPQAESETRPTESARKTNPISRRASARKRTQLPEWQSIGDGPRHRGRLESSEHDQPRRHP